MSRISKFIETNRIEQIRHNKHLWILRFSFFDRYFLCFNIVSEHFLGKVIFIIAGYFCIKSCIDIIKICFWKTIWNVFTNFNKRNFSRNPWKSTANQIRPTVTFIFVIICFARIQNLVCFFCICLTFVYTSFSSLH